MESSLRDRCGSAARSLMLAAFLVLICLVWGAGSADAAPSGPASGPTAVDLPDLALPQHEPGSPRDKAAAAAPPVTHPLQTVSARALPTVSRLPGTSSTGPIKDVPLPVTPPAGVIAAPAVSAGAVVSQAPPAVATVVGSVAPVVNPVAPVLTRGAPVIHRAVEGIDSAGAVPVQLPAPKVAPVPVQLPVPAVVPVPDQLPVPAVVPVPDQLPVPAVVPVPDQLPDTSGNVITPGARPAAAPATHAGAARPQPASAGPAPKAAVSGPGLAQLRVNAPALGAVSAVAGYSAPSSDPEPLLDAEVRLWLSAAQGSAGSSTSGPGSGGAQAAGDAAGLWHPWDARSSAQAPDLAQAPATSPSFDPGSSPD
ncbi:hypothetical protein [Arthrobacter sp. ov118]|uniref:hypothetical protein n=1 Tax=Arthrobacter sp. ov118 TaxID=1761747 RepID=UPI0008EDA976|nr:hypothetical protein [Arthrobacter sp. ov118]SFU10883.1 hypothetical protein SAMN04487915_11161 [Arthrobacter sp. ov118]